MSTATTATDSTSTAFDRQLKILNPPKTSSPIPDLPEEVYKLSPNEVKQLYQSAVDRRQALENQPLKTQKMRDVEDQERMKKYPKTTIRVRMPDHTIVQAVFQSKEKVAALYDFVRSLLETPDRKFVLCLPPRAKLVEPNITLYRAGLTPASNVSFGWIEKGVGNILKKEYCDLKEDLTPVLSSESLASKASSPKSDSSSNTTDSQGKASKPIPKWLQKGLFNKK